MIDLHISLDEKSTLGTMYNIRENFSVENNPYLIIGNRYGYDYSAFENVHRVSEDFAGFCEMLKWISKVDRVHIHGLFYVPLILILAVSKKIGEKCNWFIWGHDLYDLMDKHPTIPLKGLALLRRMAVRNIRYVSTNVPGDYQLLEKVMGRKYDFFKVRFAPFQMDGVWRHHEDAEVADALKDGTVRILLGNSATATNCHMEALEALSRYKDKDIKIYIPLSYGNAEYGRNVGDKAVALFGDKAVPMYDFMERDAYFALLAKMDIAVFAHNRQQAIGNMVPMLFAGKKVFIKEDITTWPCLTEEYGLQVYPYNNILEADFAQFCHNSVVLKNQQAQCKAMADEDLFVEAFRKTLVSERK